MNRPFIAVLAMTGFFSAIGLGIVAARTSRATTSRNGSIARLAPASTLKPDRASPDAGGGHVIRFAKNAGPVPPFLVQDIDGQIVSTAAWQGKVVLVNFWATWCPPCREEIPILIELSKSYPDKFLVIGVSMDDGPVQEVKEFAVQAGINYPIVMASAELVRAYGGVPALPTSFLINENSRVVQKHVGLFPGGVYEIEVRALLGMPVDASIETFEDTGQIFLKNVERATELPGVDLTGLTPEQRAVALKKMNSEGCDCGCGLTIAQCRMNDTSCPVSQQLAAKIVKEAQSGAKSPRGSSPAAKPVSN